ncbi:MAG: Hsp70 family protein, partial [Rhodospirillales bacterium]|nr:Hsp70 family protein [Rhodospirillales bacterium]
VKEAEEHADEDKSRRELIEARNHADALIHTTEKNLSEYGDKVSENEKTAIEDALTELREVKEGEDLDAITAKTESLTQASMKLGEAIYKASQDEAAQAAQAAEAGGDEAPEGEAPKADAADSAGDDDPNVVDADFEEVDPEKEKKAE